MGEEELNIEEKETKEAEDYKNKFLRALADFDNYRKRAAIDQENLVQFANENLIKEIIPALDSFDRALASEKTDGDDFVKGVHLVKKQLEDALVKFGVEKVEALGKPYDPNFHEAIMQKESGEKEHTVIEEVQKGYLLRGKLIRPAMVIVSKKN